MTPDNGRRPNIFPALTYDDAPAAIDFLQRAFGFEPVMVVPGQDGRVAHAELRLGPGIIMLGSSGNMPRHKGPRDLDGVHQSIYVYIDGPAVSAHYDRAKAAGARISRPLETKDYGGSGYSALDPEGCEWSFGSYLPGDAAAAHV